MLELIKRFLIILFSIKFNFLNILKSITLEILPSLIHGCILLQVPYFHLFGILPKNTLRLVQLMNITFLIQFSHQPFFLQNFGQKSANVFSAFNSIVPQRKIKNYQFFLNKIKKLQDSFHFYCYTFSHFVIIQFLNVPCASFWADARLKQIVQRCPVS